MVLSVLYNWVSGRSALSPYRTPCTKVGKTVMGPLLRGYSVDFSLVTSEKLLESDSHQHFNSEPSFVPVVGPNHTSALCSIRYGQGVVIIVGGT